MSEIAARPLGAEAGAATLSVNEETSRSGNQLRRVLVVGDALALVAAGAAALLLTGVTGRLAGLFIAAAILPGILALHVQHLYRARVAASRSVELLGLMRTSFVVAAAGFLAVRTHGNRASLSFAIVIGLLALVALFVFRSQYRSWLSRARRRGLYTRRVVLIGDNAEGRDLATLVDDHSELGIEIVGVVGVQGRPRPRWVKVPYAGDRTGVFDLLDTVGANGVIIAATALPADDANPLVRDLLDRDIHVHYSLGLRGISIDRVRPLPFAHEPLFYVEQVTLSPFQRRIKRGTDIAGSFVALVVASPLLLVAAIAIKLEDRGPVFFRQMRIGLHGEEFEILKLRSMTQSACVQHPSTGLENERTDGPLFKLASDPRRTKVGRILERTSIDELPQLINVLRGDMSLVGPRPALPEEVAVFDAELRQRHNVRPGITGLWQVEARDNPSFRAYRRLDLFYIENWSVGLDVAILLRTAESVVARFFPARKSTSARVETKLTLASLDEPTPAPVAGA